LSDPRGAARWFPLRRFEQDERRSPACHQAGPRLSWSFGALQSFHPTALATLSVTLLPSCPRRLRWTPGSSHGRTPAPARSKTGSPLMSFRAPSESSTHRAAFHANIDRGLRPRFGLLPWGLVPFSVSPLAAAAYNDWASHGPIACAFRFSRPLGAFIRPEPAGLVSCRIRSWGFALQSFAPPVQPYAVSGAHALLSLGCPPVLSETLPSRRRCRSTAPYPSEPHGGEGLLTTPAFRALLRTRVRHSRPVV
jgi:hypothetical protein